MKLTFIERIDANWGLSSIYTCSCDKIVLLSLSKTRSGLKQCSGSSKYKYPYVVR